MTTTAQIIDQHRENERWIGDGVKIECVCGHSSHATYDFSAPITEDKNNHRDAERMHAQHVADMLAAQEPQVTIRREEGKPATCEVRSGGVLIFCGRDHSADLRVAAQEETDAELDALYDAFIAHSEEERSEEFTHTEDGKPYTERICSECGEAVWIKGEHYWAATRANGARKRHHVARAALSAARRTRGGTT